MGFNRASELLSFARVGVHNIADVPGMVPTHMTVLRATCGSVRQESPIFRACILLA